MKNKIPMVFKISYGNIFTPHILERVQSKLRNISGCSLLGPPKETENWQEI
jgi:hypothetical protein